MTSNEMNEVSVVLILLYWVMEPPYRKNKWSLPTCEQGRLLHGPYTD